VREINHVLVKHRIWIAQNKSWLIFVQHSCIVVLKFLASGSEEHGV